MSQQCITHKELKSLKQMDTTMYTQMIYWFNTNDVKSEFFLPFEYHTIYENNITKRFESYKGSLLPQRYPITKIIL